MLQHVSLQRIHEHTGKKIAFGMGLWVDALFATEKVLQCYLVTYNHSQQTVDNFLSSICIKYYKWVIVV
jgi:hypothetical protein